MTLLTTMRAVKVIDSKEGDPKVALFADSPVPKPGPKDILVRVHAAGLNPADWKHAHWLQSAVVGTTCGCDYAGEVVAVGADVTLRKIGDRVIGVAHGSYVLAPDNGAFAEYVVAPESITIVVPEYMSFDVAAGQGVAALTVCQILWQSQSLPTPEKPGDRTTDFLVWSGATSAGQWLIQVAHLSGLRVIATASLKHTDRLKKLGAVEVFDYRDPHVADKIRAATNGKLRSAGVCEFTPEDFFKIVDAFSNDGGAVSLINFPPENLADILSKSGKNIKVEVSSEYTLNGEAFEVPFSSPAQPEHFIAAGKYAKLASDLLSERKIEPIPVRVVGGLDKVWDAMEDMRLGKVSGERIVFKVVE